MCGIFGVRRSWFDGRVPSPDDAFAAALASLHWRGPDGSGLVTLGDWTLGCARLAITNRRSRQPVVRRGKSLAGVLNGAITDARARWPSLLARSRLPGRLPNDAWQPVLLAQRGDMRALAAFTGHHALAVVDAEHDRLVLARDAMGEKPLFILRDDDRIVAFASSPACLAALQLPLRLETSSVAEFFARGWVAQCSPAHRALTLDPPLVGVCIARPDQPEQRVAPASQAPALEFGDALVAGVRRCADAEGPVALALSGGLDSTAIAAALQHLGSALSCYQFQAIGETSAERELARLVAKHCGHDVRPVTAGPEVLDALLPLTKQWGLPLGDPSLLAAHALAKAAAADGVRVLLSGEGSDELLLGYARHRAASWLPRRGYSRWTQRGWSMRQGARLLRAATAADPYAELLSVTPPAFRATVLAPAFAQPPTLDALDERSKLTRVRTLDLNGYLRHDLLPKLDVATMAAGIEGRCPFLDPAVRAAADQLPPERLLGKQPLRRWLAGRVPVAVLRAKKRGFALPLDRWFRGALPWLDLLRDQRTRQRAHLQVNGIDRALDVHRSGAANLGHALYLLVAFELYLRTQEGST